MRSSEERDQAARALLAHLLECIQKGLPEAVRLCLKQGADANWKTPEGKTPLSLATSRLKYKVDPHIQAEICEILLRNGADPNETVGGISLLHGCASGRQPLLCKALLNHGASHTQDPAGNTPLHLAAKTITSGNGLPFLTIKMLLENGADLHAKNTGGYTPLHNLTKLSKVKIPILMKDEITAQKYLQNRIWKITMAHTKGKPLEI